MMHFLRTYQLKWTALVLILVAFILQGLPLLNQEIEEQRFAQLMVKQFSHIDLENDQHEELLHTLQAIWSSTENAEQWASKASEYLTNLHTTSSKTTSTDLYHDILTEWNLFEQMGKRQESALLQEFRSSSNYLNTVQKNSKELLSSAVTTPLGSLGRVHQHTKLYDSEDRPTTAYPNNTRNSIVIGAP